MHASQIIKQPLITEKATAESEKPITRGARAGQTYNRYSFVVHEKATKPQIRWAVSQLYGVRVQRVATQNRKGKYRRTRWGTFQTKGFKKAVVTLHADDRIELL